MKGFFSDNSYINYINKIKDWAMTDLLIIMGLSVLLIITLRLFKISINKLEKTLINNAESSKDIDNNEAKKRINTLIGIIKGLVKIILIATYGMIVLQKLGFNIAPIIASAGIVGLAVGFGAQELVRDVISGFFILLENQIRTGDVAIINGISGLVESIQLRTITLRDFSGVVHIFQNGKIDTLANRTKGWSAAVFDIGVAYKENIKQVMDIMTSTGNQLKNDPEFNDKIIEPIEIMGLDQFGDSALIIKARLKTKPSMQWVVTREFNKRLKEAFDKENIEIPFPHTTVYWGDKISPLQLNIKEQKLPSNQ
ncbi:mechanosensitive ion channel family protein [Plebeiibacterium marinum]|uniref:Mechanosensitive ion channel family protein n=1 Tax=Plebeiibacterium marinum TaxID=2992111 RepID=A0AAE3SLI7_9BACT|nr:mechanosensitive ion channel family protein [Plebeiobacterium marinum]MCW3807489.1 mechanosensitive ion channel family protein [Plebeiobacterium marinum]